MKYLRTYLSKIWPSMVIFIFCLWAIKPLFVPGFFTMHDDEQIARLFEMNKVLLQGQIPPRWVPDLGFGYGYPLFNFYPPLVYYLGFLFHVIGFSFINATKIVIGMGFFLSGVFMYLWTKNRFGTLAGLFAALLYIYAPYHSVDIYVRGALSEFFSFVWIPAVFWSLDRLAKKPTRQNLVISGVVFSLVVLTHTLPALQFIPFLFLYILFLLLERRVIFWKLLLYFFGFGILGIGLSAYFALPSVFEKGYTLVDTILTRELANYAVHFVCPSQLWNSLWGYGGSVAGCLDGLSFQVGKVHILIAVLAFFLGIFETVRRRGYAVVVLVASGLFVFSLFMTTMYSKFIWNAISPLWYVQFPWRFLLFSAVFSSFLGGFLIFQVQKKIHIQIALIIFVLLGGVALYLIRNDFQPQTYLPVGDNYYIENQDIQWRVSSLSYEYVPKQVQTRLSKEHTTELAINKSDIPTMPFTILSGGMLTHVMQDTAVEKIINAKVFSPSILQVNTFSFPGWQVFINGKKYMYQDENSLHLIQIPLQKGAYIILVQFKNTPIRVLSNTVSVISLLLVVTLFFWRKKATK